MSLPHTVGPLSRYALASFLCIAPEATGLSWVVPSAGRAGDEVAAGVHGGEGPAENQGKCDSVKCPPSAWA